jgi:hypothetical protein
LTGDWSDLHTVVLHDMHSSPNNSGDQMKKNEMGAKKWHERGEGERGEASIGLWWKNVREGDSLGDYT